MHLDARNIDDRSVIDGDICIIGAGAAGISIALELMDLPYKVVLLEGGGFEYDDKVQELYKGKITGQTYYPLKSTRLHLFGGTTGHWGGLCSKFEPSVFEKRDWIDGSGWPFTAKEMDPYYVRAHERLELGEYSFDLDYWLARDTSLVPLPLNKEVFFNKIWRYCVPEAMKFGKKFKEKIVQSENIHLYTYANVVEIKASENVSEIREVTVKNYSGKTHKVKAKYFVLACCAIQNSRLLLASSAQASTGLGNQYDHVGRYFMENIEVKSAELWLKEPSSLQLYMRNPPNFMAELALTFNKQQELRLLNGILLLNPLDKARKIPPFIKSWTNEDPRQNRKKMEKIYGDAEGSRIKKIFESKEHSSFEVTMRLEQIPNPLSRVTLDSKEKDELGVPRANLNWTFTSLEKKTARTIYQLLGREVGIAGIGRVKVEESLLDEKDDTMPSTTSGGWHHMGTTRMSDDPRKGVVNGDCRVHSIHNLYIAGSSCFPNGAAVNPTFSIIALSIRLAEHLKKVMQTEDKIDIVKSHGKRK
jgi:choline dehydrogenase-like flavoprotein